MQFDLRKYAAIFTQTDGDNTELYGWLVYILIVVIMVGTGLALDRWYCQKQKAIYESNDNYLIR